MIVDPLNIWDLSSPLSGEEMRDIQTQYFRSMLGVRDEDKLEEQIEFLEDQIDDFRESQTSEPEGVILRLDTLRQITINVKDQQFGEREYLN